MESGQRFETQRLDHIGSVAGISRVLYLMPDYLCNKPVDLLIAPGLGAEDFNDDSLDDLYAVGVTELFAKIVNHALKVSSIQLQIVHLDSIPTFARRI